MQRTCRKILAIILAVMVAMTYTQIGFAGEIPSGADGAHAKAGKSLQAKAAKDTGKEDSDGESEKEKPTKAPQEAADPQPDPSEGSDSSPSDSGSAPADGGSESQETGDQTGDNGNTSDSADDPEDQEDPSDAPETTQPSVETGQDQTSSSSERALAAVKKVSGNHSTFIEPGSTALADGEYAPDSFSFTGGTGKVKIKCDKFTVSGKKAKAVIRFTSTNFTHLFTGTVEEKHNGDDSNADLYDPGTGKMGKGVYALKKDGSTAVAEIPVDLNSDMKIAGRTVAMSEPHWITYTIHITSKAAQDAEEAAADDPADPTDPADSTDPTDPTDPADPADPEDPTDTDDSTEPTDPVQPTAPKDPTPTKKKKLDVGTWKVKATTCRVMFYLYPKEKDPARVILKIKKNGSMMATITLTGDGYDYVYMGTPSQAKKAGKKNWIKAKVVNGYYTFKVPVSKLDKKLNITPHSSKYESDGDVTTEPWRPDKWIIFYSDGAKKVKDGTSIDTKPRKDQDSGSESNSDSDNSGGTQTRFENDNKADKVSKWKDDSGKSTSAVDNSTSLKDGVYTPDKFHWSGGSGRLAYIRCNKITVRGGKAYATIEFSSSRYDSLKANGSIYSKQGGGNSKFVIPIKLNANNTIIGRTTAMSQPHWVKYTIFVYKAGATAASKDAAEGTDGHVTNTEKLTDKAPDLLGMKSEGAVEVKYAKYFKIFKYEQGISLISVDQTSGTALEKPKKDEDTKKDTEAAEGAASGTDEAAGQDTTSKRSDFMKAAVKGSMSAEAVDRKAPTAVLARVVKASRTSMIEEAYAADATEEELEGATAADGAASASEAETSGSGSEEKIEYDEDGKPIAKTDSERTNDLYQNDVVNYLIVPKNAELPAGLEKDCVIIEQPVEHAYIASPEGLAAMAEMSLSGSVGIIGMPAGDVKDAGIAKAVKKGTIKTDEDYQAPDFRQVIQEKTDLVLLPAELLPKKIEGKESGEDQELSKEETETLRKLQTRYSALNIPMLVDRSSDEEDSYGRAEWIKVYGAIFGEEKAAEELVEKYEKEHENEKISDQ